MGIYNLEKLFSPSVVAVVGRCSCSLQSKEWQLYSNLAEAGGNPVYMVSGELQCSCDCPIPQDRHYRSLEDLPEAPGLVFTFAPLAEIPEQVDICGSLGVVGLIITVVKRSLADDLHEAEILRRAKRLKLRIFGFNSRGFMVPGARINVSLFDIPARDGGLALLSQSGAVITSMLGDARERGIGFSHVISLGALSDIDFGDMIDFLGWSARVSCILLYIENLKDVKKFMSACRSVARIKPIVAIKAGKSELGREVIKKHTGCPAGEDRVYDTAFRRAGIIRVDTVDELLEAGDLLIKSCVPAGARLGIVTNSGGLGVLAVDGLAQKGITVTALSTTLGERMREYIAPYSGSLDPICIAGDADCLRYRKVLDFCLEAREFDIMIVVVVLSHWLDPVPMVEEMRAKAAAAKVNLVYVWLGDRIQYESEALALSDKRTKICFSIEDAVLSCHYALRYYDKLSKLVVIPQRYSREVDYCQESLLRARNRIKEFLVSESLQLSSYQSRELLAYYGLPVNPSVKVTSFNEVVESVAIRSYPIVMKLDHQKLLHKSDHGAVLLNLRSEDAVAKGVERLKQVAAAAGLAETGLTLEDMVENVDYEINLGSRRDVEFGPYIFLGAGGLQARVVADEEVILPPLDRLLARKLIARTRMAECHKIRPFDLVKLEEIIVRVAQMIVDLPELETVVMHPLVIANDRFIVVDAKITLNDRGVVSPHHLSTVPYPNQYEFNETLRDGTAVLIRPIKPEDAAAHYEMVASFSPQTRYYRFFSLREEITPEQMVRFTQIDYDRDVAIIAEIERDGKKMSIGVNRLVYYPHSEEYEFAVVVTDAWQGSGVGRLLMEKLIYIARDRGIEEIFGLVLRDNISMMRFIKSFGFEIVGSEYDVFRIRLNLRKEHSETTRMRPLPRVIF
ncbi:MAG: bifunctional acetate--CoA ligase family protein/GNAT family N-acetyltransferase [Deltaproteobacteria bacterium]|nr:bifunctional acetate--CoA ligase family protein/GNAT family N-acetyltransferase [Deltaproteobacteria bacterium]